MAIGNTSNKTCLIGNREGSDEYAYKEGVGSVILEMAAVVPDGLLVFMPSYPMMKKLIAHWRTDHPGRDGPSAI